MLTIYHFKSSDRSPYLNVLFISHKYHIFKVNLQFQHSPALILFVLFFFSLLLFLLFRIFSISISYVFEQKTEENKNKKKNSFRQDSVGCIWKFIFNSFPVHFSPPLCFPFELSWLDESELVRVAGKNGASIWNWVWTCFVLDLLDLTCFWLESLIGPIYSKYV